MTSMFRGHQIARTSKVAAAGLTFALALAACGSESSTSSGTATSGSGTKLAATLNASGSTFQKNLEENAIAAFTQANPGVTINYAGGGSAKGKQDLADKLVDFAGTDSPVKPEDLGKFKGAALLYFPVAAAPIAVVYNLDGVSGLKLSGPTIAKIFQGDIKTWNDPAIAAENSGVTLPNTAITIVHRSDGSGTTNNFAKFLVKSADGVWKLDKGDTLSWPKNSVGAEKNTGVANAVAQTKGAIGYVDFADAKKASLAMASVKNAAGEFVAPSLDGASKAVAASQIAADLTFAPADASGAGVYPITAPTWILVYAKQSDAAKGNALKGYLQYLLTDGQKLAPTVDYAPLPTELATKATDQLAKLQIG